VLDTIPVRKPYPLKRLNDFLENGILKGCRFSSLISFLHAFYNLVEFSLQPSSILGVKYKTIVVSGGKYV
jgi:hypothetical protein